MRSLPENDFWNAMRTRLRNYEEAPAKDDWEFIAAAIKPVSPWYKRRSVIALAALLLVSGSVTWFALPTQNGNNIAGNGNAYNGQVTVADSAVPPANTIHKPVIDGISESDAELSETSQNSTMAHIPTSDQSQVYDNNAVRADQAQSSTAGRIDPSTRAANNAASQQTQTLNGTRETSPASASQRSPAARTTPTHASTTLERVDAFHANAAANRAGADAQQSRDEDSHETSSGSSSPTSSASTSHVSNKSDGNASTTSADDNAHRQAEASTVANAAAHNHQVEQPMPQESGRPGAVSQSVAQSSSLPAQQSSTANNGSTTPSSANGKTQGNAGTERANHTNAINPKQTGNAASHEANTTSDIINTSAIATAISATDTLGAGATTVSAKRNGQGEALVAQATDSLPKPKDSTLVKVNHKQSVAPARKDQEQKKVHLRPVLYFSLAPSLAFQKIMPLRNDDIHIASLSDDGMFSSNRMGISLETGAQFTVVKGLELYGGLLYYQQSQTIKYSYTVPSSTILDAAESMDYVITPQGGTREFRYAMRNIGGSAGFLYTVKDAKLMHKIGAGVQYQYGLRATRSGDTYKNSGSQYLNYQVHYRLEWAAAGRTRLYVQPAFVHSFWTTENLREPLTIKPYRVAFTFGVNVSF